MLALPQHRSNAADSLLSKLRGLHKWGCSASEMYIPLQSRHRSATYGIKKGGTKGEKKFRTAIARIAGNIFFAENSAPGRMGFSSTCSRSSTLRTKTAFIQTLPTDVNIALHMFSHASYQKITCRPICWVRWSFMDRSIVSVDQARVK